MGETVKCYTTMNGGIDVYGEDAGCLKFFNVGGAVTVRFSLFLKPRAETNLRSGSS